MTKKTVGQSFLAGLLGALTAALAVFAANPHGAVSDPLGTVAPAAAAAAASAIGGLLIQSPHVK